MDLDIFTSFVVLRNALLTKKTSTLKSLFLKYGTCIDVLLLLTHRALTSGAERSACVIASALCFMACWY